MDFKQLVGCARTVSLTLGTLVKLILSIVFRDGVLLSLERVAHTNDAVVVTGYTAAHENQVLFGVDLFDFQVRHGDARVTELAGHLHALDHFARTGARTNCTTVPESFVGTVRALLDLKPVTLHDAGKATAL